MEFGAMRSKSVKFTGKDFCMSNTIEVNIDTRGYSQKPIGPEMAVINDRIKDNIQNLALEDFVELVGSKGVAFTRAMLKHGTKAENFEKQKLLGLDFDGTIEYSDFKERCEVYRIPVLFTYKTLSCCKKDFRFRAIFMLDEWIKNIQLADAVNLILQKIFPEADKACKNRNRIFLGGKGIIDKDLNARINAVELARSMELYLKNEKGKNYRARLRPLAKEAGIGTYKGKLGIFSVSDFVDGEAEKLKAKIIDGDVLMVLPEADNKDIGKLKEKRDNPLKKILTCNEQELCQICPLLKKFVLGEDIPHACKFLLLTSLCHIKGGDKLFMRSVKKEDQKKWSLQCKYVQNNYNHAQNCTSELCEYWEQCQGKSLYERASRKIKKLQASENFISIEQSEKELASCLKNAIEAMDRDIYVIKAQTALGKTEQYCLLIKSYPSKKFIIAVPTIALQYEIAERLRAMGIECEITESISSKIEYLGIPKLERLVKEAYDMGYGMKIRKIINQFVEEHREEITVEQAQKINEIINKKENVIGKARCIVTTHALFLKKELYRQKGYEMIIDEDLLMTIFKQTNKISLKVLKKLLKIRWLSKTDKDTISDLIKLKDGEIRSVEFSELLSPQLDELYEKRGILAGPVPVLFKSSFAAMHKSSGNIIFTGKKSFEDSEKMIIVSATADKEIYKDYFKGKELHFDEIQKAAYKGKVKQYSSYSLSRVFFRKNGMLNVIKQIQEKYIGEIPIISFKMLFTDSKIHFGKTEGFDEYRGKDIAVIGTPHNAPVLYKLSGALLGYDTSDHLTTRRIERNGYSFTIMTYGKKQMQNLQLYYIESELEQAIGRARPLRCECQVSVFSNYPCQQAEMIQEPYLELESQEEPEIDEEELDA